MLSSGQGRVPPFASWCTTAWLQSGFVICRLIVGRGLYFWGGLLLVLMSFTLFFLFGFSLRFVPSPGPVDFAWVAVGRLGCCWSLGPVHPHCFPCLLMCVLLIAEDDDYVDADF